MEEERKSRDLSVRPAAEPTPAADFLDDGETEVHLLRRLADRKVKIFFQIVHRHSSGPLPLLRLTFEKKKKKQSDCSVFALFL